MGEHWHKRLNPRGLWAKGTPNESLPDLFADRALGDQRRAWFRSYLEKKNDCEVWRGSRHPAGYGAVNIGGRTRKAHRVAYAMHYGIDPGDLQVCHKCDNPPCCKKSHLFLGTSTDNVRDCVRKGRINPAQGERMPHAVLTEAKVRQMRRLHASGVGWKRLAKDFGVGRTTAKMAVLGITWAHVK